MPILDGAQALDERVGTELGVSDWAEITQQHLKACSDVSGDHQWIHVDVKRSKTSTFRGTIAHRYFTQLPGPRLQYSHSEIRGFAFGLNYRLNKFRSSAPMPVAVRISSGRALRRREDGTISDISKASTSERASLGIVLIPAEVTLLDVGSATRQGPPGATFPRRAEQNCPGL